MHKWKIGQKFRLRPGAAVDSSTLRDFTPGKVYRVGSLYKSGEYCFPMLEGNTKTLMTWHYNANEYKDFMHYWEPVKEVRRKLPEWF